MSEYKCYVGCKIIDAKPATYGEYKKEKYGDKQFESNIPDSASGYMVKYPPIGGDQDKPHLSWSPLAVFQNGYREICESEKNVVFAYQQSDGEDKVE